MLKEEITGSLQNPLGFVGGNISKQTFEGVWNRQVFPFLPVLSLCFRKESASWRVCTDQKHWAG